MGFWIRVEGWERFCTLEVLVYPKLDHMFFENMRIEIISIKSMVKDVLTILDVQWIGRIFEMLRIRICFLALERKLDGLKVILVREDVRNLKNLQANQLLMEIRLIHNMVVEFFFKK